MKHLEGKKVFLRPTGNNVPRGKNSGSGCVWATMVKVARVNVTIQKDGSSWEQKLRKSTHNDKHIEGGCNGGWLVYSSEDEYQKDKHKEYLSHKISDRIRYTSDLNKLTHDQVNQIAEILDIEGPL